MARVRRFNILAKAGLFALASGLVGVVACVSTDADVRPQNARVTVTGTSPTPLQLVTSTDFFEELIGEGTEIRAILVDADTTVVNPPFDQTFPLSSLGSVLVRLIQPDSTPSDVTMQVWLDGVLEYEQAATMSQGASIEYRFVFRSRSVN